jgi:hypothetical protein
VNWTGSTRYFVVLSLLAGGMAFAQVVLPVTAPTTTAKAASSDGVAVAAVAVRPAAEVHSANGKLEVVADGSSLAQILEQIGRVTGMKITGRVADERVYGRYGPGPASEILSALLDGTGCNMLLRETTAGGAGELILTARTGGVTPPDPNARTDEYIVPLPNVPGNPNYQRPIEQLHLTEGEMHMYAERASQHGNAAGEGGGSPGQPSPPNPQQIYQQLQRLQQSQPGTQQRTEQ